MRDGISVCIASYNGEKRIQRQLQSIIQQINENDEIIIVDDSSTDKTLEIINGFHNQCIKLRKHEHNQGYVKSFEDSIALATHDVVFLSDQDDEWMPNKVERIADFFEDPEVGLVIHNVEVTNAKGSVIEQKYFKHGLGKYFINRHLFNSHNLGCAMAFRRSLLKFLLPFPSIVESHDEWIGINADMNKCKVVFVDENLIKWIRYGDNATDKEAEERSFMDKVLTRIKQIGCALVCFFRRTGYRFMIV